jgi:hypothetical protein
MSATVLLQPYSGRVPKRQLPYTPPNSPSLPASDNPPVQPPSHPSRDKAHVPSHPSRDKAPVERPDTPQSPVQNTAYPAIKKSALKSSSTFPSGDQGPKQVKFEDPMAGELAGEEKRRRPMAKKAKMENPPLKSASHWVPTTIEEFHAYFKSEPSRLDSIVPSSFWEDDSGRPSKRTLSSYLY